MSRHIDTGKAGEAIAAQYMADKGYTILHKNWRHGRWDIDLVCVKDKVLHFIEIKTRTSTAFGNPEERVDRKKLRNMMDASEEFLETNPGWPRIQFDVLCITLGDVPDYFLIEDVYL